ncbi:MAG TPA: hypothetical protein EYH05_09505 [Anaerolineae bacterium]|nr:hypothetical protein [Anaerolineae bacterium]
MNKEWFEKPKTISGEEAYFEQVARACDRTYQIWQDMAKQVARACDRAYQETYEAAIQALLGVIRIRTVQLLAEESDKSTGWNDVIDDLMDAEMTPDEWLE